MWYDKLNNKRLWKIFSDISAIPRESGNLIGFEIYGCPDCMNKLRMPFSIK